MEAVMRRHRYTLYYSGIAVLVFCAWGLIKIELSMHYDERFRAVFQPPSGENAELIYMLTLFFYYLIIALEALVRAYIGLSAISEGKGKHKTPIYLIVTILYLVTTISMSGIAVYEILRDSTVSLDLDAFEQTITSSFIDLTSNVSFVLIIYSSIRIRMLMKKNIDCTINTAAQGPH